MGIRLVRLHHAFNEHGCFWYMVFVEVAGCFIGDRFGWYSGKAIKRRWTAVAFWVMCA